MTLDPLSVSRGITDLPDAANWTSANPVLSGGEPGFETDTGKLKIGDGSTAWNTLGYV